MTNTLVNPFTVAMNAFTTLLFVAVALAGVGLMHSCDTVDPTYPDEGYEGSTTDAYEYN